jgi:cytochrome c553
MQAHPKLTKQEQRELLRTLKDRRERQTPQHHSPAWVHLYWRRLSS